MPCTFGLLRLRGKLWASRSSAPDFPQRVTSPACVRTRSYRGVLNTQPVALNPVVPSATRTTTDIRPFSRVPKQPLVQKFPLLWPAPGLGFTSVWAMGYGTRVVASYANSGELCGSSPSEVLRDLSVLGAERWDEKKNISGLKFAATYVLCVQNAFANLIMQAGFSSEEVERYSRQMLLPQVGVSGQSRIKKARILIVGVGGLGCPATLYLAGAGVGTLGFVDRPGDVVERSNLHRQIAHTTTRVGCDKVQSAITAASTLNPHVEFQTHDSFTEKNGVSIASNYDVVLDCTDNVRSRYLINDACVQAGKPLVSGSAIGLDGQLTVYGLGEDSPCYRCVFPEPPPPACVGSCDAAGVLGPVPGTIGTLMALEALKIIGQLKSTEPLTGRLLLFDGASMQFRTVRLRSKHPNCVVCGNTPSVSVQDFNYTAFAQRLPQSTILAPDENQIAPDLIEPHLRISVTEFSALRKTPSSTHTSTQPLNYCLIDCRPTEQYEMCALPEAHNIPLTEMQHDKAALERIMETAGQRQIVMLCRRGNKSQTAVQLLRRAGCESVRDVIGGLQAWHHEVDEKFPLY